MQVAASLDTPIERLKRIVKDNGLPPAPRGVGMLLASMRRPQFDVRQCESILESDAAFAAAVIAFANSGAANARGCASSVAAALAQIGHGTAITLLGEALASGAFPYSDDSRLDAQRSRTALGVALAAQLVELASDAAPDHIRTFIALRDCAVMSLLPCFARSAAEGIPSAPHQEEQSWGVTHTRAGALLAASWGLDDALVGAIRDHHRSDLDAMATRRTALPPADHRQEMIAIGLLVDQAQARLGDRESDVDPEQPVRYAERVLRRPGSEILRAVDQACERVTADRRAA